MYCWEELTGKAGRRLTEMVGRRWTRAQLLCDARSERDLYIPIPFHFTQNSGSALPLAALAYHGVQVSIEFAKLEQLIVVSGSHCAVRNARTGLGITSNDLRAEMEISYVFLDQAERDKFSNSSFQSLCVQTQHYFKTDSAGICRMNLAFNHPTLELIFVVRRKCQEAANNWGNFSSVHGKDPVRFAQLLLNTVPRFQKKPGVYYRSCVPYERHSNIPI